MVISNINKRSFVIKLAVISKTLNNPLLGHKNFLREGSWTNYHPVQTGWWKRKLESNPLCLEFSFLQSFVQEVFASLVQKDASSILTKTNLNSFNSQSSTTLMSHFRPRVSSQESVNWWNYFKINISFAGVHHSSYLNLDILTLCTIHRPSLLFH